MRSLSREQYLLLKAATRTLIKNCGGLEAAAAVTRVGTSSLSDYCSVEKSDVFIPLDVALDLQIESGTYPITEALAALSGGSFVPADAQDANPCLTIAAADLMGETADAVKSISESMKDGKITKREKQDIVKQGQDVIHAVTGILSLLNETNGGSHGAKS